MKKTIKFLTVGMLLVGMSAMVGCKKYVKKEDADKSYVSKNVNNNTVQSETFTVTSSDWQGSSSSGYWYYDYYATNVDMSGAVLLYQKNGTKYVSISTTVYASSYGAGIGYGYDTSNNMLEVEHSSVDSGSLSNPGMEQYKIVTIPASSIKTHPDLDLRNYKEVSRVLNVK